MKILFYRYKSIFEPDCYDAFTSFGIEVDELYNGKENDAYSFSLAANMINDAALNGKPYLFVLSINFFPILSDICQKLGIIYVCWSVDCPVNELLFNQIKNPCNRVFLFDYSQYQRFSKYNPGHIYYLPLATNAERMQESVAKINESDIKRFSSDISFVGSLYNEKNPLKGINLSDKTRGFIDGLIAAQLKIFGCNFIEESLTDEVVKEIKGGGKTAEESFVEPLDRYVIAHTYIGSEITERERIEILNSLAKRFKVDLYTQSDCSNLSDVNVKGPANSVTEMPKIFNLSKINLNITMRPIQTGLSLRIYDVLGSGGFLITNYQSEIPNLFEIGKDLVVYESIEDLIDKCDYYLAHDKERKEIAQNGYRKVKEYHNCKNRVRTMIELMTGEG